MFQNVHEPIIERAVFEQVQQKRGKMRKRRTSNGEHNMSVSYTHLDVYKRQVLPRGHAGPCAGDFIGQDGVLLALLHSALLPFVR